MDPCRVEVEAFPERLRHISAAELKVKERTGKRNETDKQSMNGRRGRKHIWKTSKFGIEGTELSSHDWNTCTYIHTL